MSENFIPLQDVSIARPCPASWEAMSGNNRVRFCQTCAKNVYNLSDMSRTEAERLVNQHEGDMCGRFYQRADGTIITDECPVGLRAARRPLKWLAASFIALLGAGASILQGQPAEAQGGSGARNPSALMSSLAQLPPIKKLALWLSEESTEDPPVAGGIGMPPEPAPSPAPDPQE